MKNKVYLGEDGFVCVDVLGDQNYQLIKEVAEQIDEMCKAIKKQNKQSLFFGKPQNKRAYVLVDLSSMGKQDSGARRAGQEGFNFIHFDKMAIFGNPFLKNVANLVAKATGKTDTVKFFQTKEEAVRWLQS